MEYYSNFKVVGSQTQITSNTEMNSLTVGTIIEKVDGKRFQKGTKGQWKEVKSPSPLTFQVVGTSLYIYTN